MPTPLIQYDSHWIAKNGRFFEIRSRRGVEMGGIETEGSAEGHLAAFLADEDEALVNRELDRLYDLVNAQGGVAMDAAGKARVRAVIIVLAAIDSISAPAASHREAA